jgi:hypothetical protein
VINCRAIRAVVAANFVWQAGLLILLTTVVWVVWVWALPGAYDVLSIWYLAAFGAWAGLGFRFCCATPRAYLVPGLREYNRLIRFALLSVVACAVAAGKGDLETVPAFLAILWFCALVGFYLFGLFRHPVLAGGLAVVLGATFGAETYLIQLYRDLYPSWAVLFLLNVPLTMWVWRRIGTHHDLTFILPGAGALSAWLETREERRSRKEPLDFSRFSWPTALSFPDRVRLFSFPVKDKWWRPLSVIAFWSGIVAFRFEDTSTDWSGPAFGTPLALPLIPGLLTVGASARMFMLPLRRSEIIRCLGTARFIRQLQSWAEIALPFAVGALLKGTALPTVCLAVGATLAAQLPIFGLMLWAHGIKTASGVRYSVFLGAILFVAAFVLSRWWNEPRMVADTLLLSLALGPLLIWLAYRRWLNTEVGLWASLPNRS